MSQQLQTQNYYWLVKEGNEYEYTDQYYIYGSIEDIDKKLRDIIIQQFNSYSININTTKRGNQVYMFVNNMLGYPINDIDVYQFEEFDIRAIKKPNIKSSKNLKHECYDATNNMQLMNGA